MGGDSADITEGAQPDDLLPVRQGDIDPSKGHDVTVKLNGGGPLDGNVLRDAAPIGGHYLVWTTNLEGLTVVHLYDQWDGSYQGERQVCGKPFPIWVEEVWAYVTHYCGLWEGHESVAVFQHLCPCGASDQEDTHGF